MKKSYPKSSYPVFFIIILFTALFMTTAVSAADCDWNSGDSYKMHWPQEPDLNRTGVAIAMTMATLADDFECSGSGPIEDIHFWGSFYRDNLPPNGPDSLTFKISIYSDIPAIGDLPSKPGDLLWTQTFVPGEYSAERIHVGLSDWYDGVYGSYSRQNHRYTFQYNFCIDDDPFIQEEGTIYWLVVDEVGQGDYEFGWKTTTRDLRWNDDAVLRLNANFPWVELIYPNVHEYKGESLDLAFVITGTGTGGNGGDQTERQYDWGDAPDGAAAPGYPTLSTNNGAYHIIDGPWLGDDTDQPDSELNGQPESNALGDDLDIEPLFSIGTPNDDEDGVFIPPMYRGQPADITLMVGGGGFVDAWVDFDGNMSWQASEKICWWFLPEGIHTISFIVPDDAVCGETFARFRISRDGTSYPWGPADSGEVEDHLAVIHDNCAQCTGQEFIRGDVDQDAEVTDADVTLIMNYVLSGAPTPECMDAADADDNGVVDIKDTTYIVHYLNGGPVIPEPFPDCGPDPTDDTLTCDQYDNCPGNTLIITENAKWFNLPDVTENGIDIRIDSNDGTIRRIADDFECRNENLLTDIHLWCSWKYDIRGTIEKIHIGIHSDDPVGFLGNDPDNEFSKPSPGVLWEMDFLPDEFRETLYYTLPDSGEWWWDPINGELIEGGDNKIWRIDINIDPNMAFRQQGTIDDPRIYWLEVQVDANNGEFGWKTRRWPDHYMDDAVWDIGTEMPRFWKELRYPKGHAYHDLERDSIDMAFCLTYTHGESMPTSRPVSATQCPIAATQCPTVATRCPPVNTQCPVVQTQCPPLETQCVAITTCPPTETRCPVAPTRCPIVSTECPVYETRCPPTDTKCPVVDTQCPIVETECPVYETRCPPSDTQCPVVYTQCPFLETACYAITNCPSTETTCPVAYTQCPVVYTQCPPDVTRCPPVETRCPSVYTKCPPTSTICTAVSTECPPIPTQCPQEPTLCTPTQCPEETLCPVASTKCPVVQTECPAYETRCPTTDTQCPPVVYTRCPAVETECPAYQTRCYQVETECPAVDTKCPVVDTQCPIVQTECSAYETRCPPVETKCPVIGTWCPIVETECPNVDTECPEAYTKCPATPTACSGGDICLIKMSPICDPFLTFTPGCSPLGSNGTQSSRIERECPVIETMCPTVISTDLLAKSM